MLFSPDRNQCWRWCGIGLVVVLTLSAVAETRAAEDSVEQRLERMESVIREQQAQLEEQRAQLAEQAELIRALLEERGGDSKASEAQVETAASPAERLAVDTTLADEGADESTAASDARPAGQEAAAAELARRRDEGTAEREVDARATLYDPSNTVYDPEFPGAWHLPGTTAAMKIGGYVNLALINSFDPLVSTDRFIVGTIPPTGEVVPGARSGTAVSASQTRINYEVREETTRGTLRAFIEGDFEGSGDSFRLRHAFGQYGPLLAGKTWSAFSNTDALPEEVDFEGVNGVVLRRQSQLRYFPKVGRDVSMIVSLEDPGTEVENGVGLRGGMADIIVSMDRLPLGELGSWNYQVSAIYRQLDAQTEDEAATEGSMTENARSTSGWGLTTSGRVPFRRLGEDNFLLWQLTYGKGIGRYVNDLSTVGGGDAVIDPDGNLRALPVFAGFVSYRHAWPRMPWVLEDLPGIWRSNFTISWVDVDNFEFQSALSYKRTLRASANLLYFPTQNVRLGTELMWGERTNKDGSKGTAAQFQLSARYDF